jgi:hypothetical protein
MLPLLIGDLILEGDRYFSLILILLEIMDIVFLPNVTMEQTIILEDLIHRMYSRFYSLFPTTRPINKFHHMAHYPAAIPTYGPLIGYLCMRYEAYQNLCKRLVHVNCNFINVPKSVAYHLQTIACFNRKNNSLFHNELPTLGPKSAKSLDSNQTEYRWVKSIGWHIRIESVILLKHSFENPSGYPEFGKISKIFFMDAKFYFAVLVLETITFNQHLYSFELQPYNPIQSILIAFDTLKPIAPTWLLKSFNDADNITYANVRHFV